MQNTYIHGIIGDVGSGKTCLLTTILYNAFLHSNRVLANYNLTFPYTLTPFSKIAELGVELTNAYIGLDELGRGADSYEFFQEQPRKISTFVAEIRKRQCRLFYTTQRRTDVTKRIRMQTKRWFMLEDLDSNKTHNILEDCACIFQITTLNEYYETLGVSIFDGNTIKPLYNTLEIIWPTSTPKKKSLPILGKL